MIQFSYSSYFGSELAPNLYFAIGDKDVFIRIEYSDNAETRSREALDKNWYFNVKGKT